MYRTESQIQLMFQIQKFPNIFQKLTQILIKYLRKLTNVCVTFLWLFHHIFTYHIFQPFDCFEDTQGVRYLLPPLHRRVHFDISQECLGILLCRQSTDKNCVTKLRTNVKTIIPSTSWITTHKIRFLFSEMTVNSERCFHLEVIDVVADLPWNRLT